MKLIVAIIQSRDRTTLLSALSEFRVTLLSSTCCFVKSGSTTLMIGIEDEYVTKVLELIKLICKSRKKLVAPTPMGGYADTLLIYPVEVTVGGATTFVLPIEEFHQF